MGRLLSENAPAPWEWIRSIGTLDGDATMIESVYQPLGLVGGEPEWYVIEDAERDGELADCYQQLARLLSEGNSGLFAKCHYFLDRNGQYRADYEY